MHAIRNTEEQTGAGENSSGVEVGEADAGPPASCQAQARDRILSSNSIWINVPGRGRAYAQPKSQHMVVADNRAADVTSAGQLHTSPTLYGEEQCRQGEVQM